MGFGFVVARFGLFARLDETGADGIIPLQSLPQDYYHFDEKKQAFIGRRTKRVFRLAQPVTVKLEEADRLTGSMRFKIVENEENSGGEKTPTPPKKSHRHRNEKNRYRPQRHKRKDG